MIVPYFLQFDRVSMWYVIICAFLQASCVNVWELLAFHRHGCDVWALMSAHACDVSLAENSKISYMRYLTIYVHYPE